MSRHRATLFGSLARAVAGAVDAHWLPAELTPEGRVTRIDPFAPARRQVAEDATNFATVHVKRAER